MKDENDKATEDAFTSFEQIEREGFITDALISGGHYQSVLQCSRLKISGRRYNNTTTPDAVRDLWESPKEVVAWMAERYGPYDLDAAASESNKVCDKFYSQQTNCLKRWWGSRKHVWLNPPYSAPDAFVLKAIEQMDHDNQIDMLLPADNSTAWFRDAQQNAAEVIWIVADVEEVEGGGQYSRTGRLAFTSGESGKPVDGNNKGSVIFVMRKLKDGEQQQTHYIPISEICPSVTTRKRMKKRSV